MINLQLIILLLLWVNYDHEQFILINDRRFRNCIKPNRLAWLKPFSLIQNDKSYFLIDLDAKTEEVTVKNSQIFPRLFSIDCRLKARESSKQKNMNISVIALRSIPTARLLATNNSNSNTNARTVANYSSCMLICSSLNLSAPLACQNVISHPHLQYIV